MRGDREFKDSFSSVLYVAGCSQYLRQRTRRAEPRRKPDRQQRPNCIVTEATCLGLHPVFQDNSSTLGQRQQPSASHKSLPCLRLSSLPSRLRLLRVHVREVAPL